jgi:hypothetical protein
MIRPIRGEGERKEEEEGKILENEGRSRRK